MLRFFTKKNKNQFCDESDPDLCPGKFYKDTQGKIYKSVPKNYQKPNTENQSPRSSESKSIKYQWVPGINHDEIAKLSGDTKNNIFIHANGDRPFKIMITGKNVKIYKGDYAFQQYFYKPHLRINNPGAIFIGQNPPMISADMFEEYPGNTILIELKNGSYLYICENIYEFKPVAGKITEYYSYVGNNDVPYPYARDETYTYLLAYSERIKNSYLDMKEDPYGQNLKNAEPILLPAYFQTPAQTEKRRTTLRR